MLDTNICIYLIKNHPREVRERFEQRDISSICLSAITVAELSFGVAKSSSPNSHQLLAGLLAMIKIVPFGTDEAWHYGKLRALLEQQGTPIGPLDTQIAAHALAIDCTLVTNNEREFKRVPGLRVENWIS